MAKSISTATDQSRKGVKPGKPMFIIENGKTYIVDENDRQEFGDFCLKLLGELIFEGDTGDREGHWVASCSAYVRGVLETRTVVLSASAFDSRQRFMEQLRRRFGSGTFNISGNVKVANALAHYYSTLKEDAQSNPDCTGKVFFHADHLGYQKGTYWILSPDLHVLNGKILPASHHQHFISDATLGNYSTALGGHLLERDVLSAVTKKYLEMSTNFGNNQTAFLLATAFVICSGMKSVLTKLGADFSDESCIGVVCSTERNVGKSLTLQLLAKGQGIDKRSHPLLCSGGDQNVSGTSLKVIMHALQSTTLTCLVDDPVLTTTLSEFLLQVQSGLPQGSLRSGLNTPKGSVLISTNSAECERIHGRIVRLDYVKDPSFSKENETMLQTKLKDLVLSHEGFLVAWTILFLPRWLNSDRRKEHFVDKLREVLAMLVPEQQPRWHKGTAQLLYTYVVLHQIAGLEPDIIAAFKQLSNSGKTLQHVQQQCSFWERLEAEIEDKLKTAQPVLTWINPTVNVSVGGNFEPAIAIPSREISTFTSLKSAEIPEELQKVVDPQKSKTSSLLFAVDGSATIPDIRKKTVKSSNAKGYKIPKSCLTRKLVHKIEFASGMRDEYVEEEQEQEMTENQDILSEDLLDELRRLAENLNEFDKAESESDEENPAFNANASEEFPSSPTEGEASNLKQELSPVSSLRWSVLSPKSRNLFKEGLMAGQRLEKRRNQVRVSCETRSAIPATKETPSTSTAAAGSASPTEQANETPSTSISGSDMTHAKRSLFDVVDGSVGVLKRSRRDRVVSSETRSAIPAAKETPSTSTAATAGRASPTEQAHETPSTSISGSDITHAKSTSIDVVDGSVGVSKRSRRDPVVSSETRSAIPSAKDAPSTSTAATGLDEDNEENICRECQKETPPKMKKGRGHKKISWVECENCHQWYHVSCTDLQRIPKNNEKWKCKKC